MDILRVALTGLILAALLSFHYKSELSRFEINRLAAHKKKYKSQAKFLDIYPGILTLMRILSLASAILLTTFATLSWGVVGGGFVAFAAILLAWLLGRMFHKIVQNILDKHLDSLNKYFAWAGVLGNLVIVGDEFRVNSEHELAHLIEAGDFLDVTSKNLVKNALTFRDMTAERFMTARDHIAFVHSKDALTPVFIDELFNSGHKVFPVAQGGLDHVVGFLILEDILPVDQEEKILIQKMRKAPPPVEPTAPLESALRQMCEYHTTALMVEKNDKTVGFLTLTDIVRALFDAK